MSAYWSLVLVLVLTASAAADSTSTAPVAAPAGTAAAPAAKSAPADTAAAAPARGRKAPAAKAAGPAITKVKLRMRHRVHANFMDEAEVRLRQDFPIGDSEYSGRVLRYVPDFTMDKGKVSSRSSEPRNPAFQIVVKEDGAPHDTTWAFLNFPPHFSRRSVIAFQVLRIDFADRPSLFNKADSSQAGRP